MSIASFTSSLTGEPFLKRAQQNISSFIALTRAHVDVLLDEAELCPEGEVGERGVEAELRLDDGADADVGAEVRVEVGRVARAGGAPVARLQDHHPTGLLQNSMQSE